MADEQRSQQRQQHRWFTPWAWAFGGGAAIGLLYALIFRPSGEVFLTDSWSYVPKDDWWLHAVVVGVTMMLIYAAILIGYWLVGFLFRRGIAFRAVGVLLTAAGLTFLGRAAMGDESTGGRIAWIAMGLPIGALGVAMFIGEWRGARRR